MSILFSLDSASVLLGGVVLLCVLWWLSTRRPPGLPPGPGPALPLLGHLHLLPKDPRPQFWTWRRQYGDVFSLYMGRKLVVVLASYSAIHEALVTMADVFSDRPHSDFIDSLRPTRHQGIVMASGRDWKEQRKTSLEILRAMGMGKNVLANKIQEEVTHYIRAIKDHQGAPIDLAEINQISVCNNICSIVFGRRYDYGDPEFSGFMKRFDHSFKLFSDLINWHDISADIAVLLFLPVLRFIPGDPFKTQEIRTVTRLTYSFIDSHVHDHKRVLADDKNAVENTDFIYCYLRQIRQHRIRDNLDTTLNGDNLRMVVGDLFTAGTETTATALRWALLFFLHHPDVQDKCFKEISDVIGPHRPPTMHDKPNLTYLEATICEVLRKGDVIPLSVHHATADAVTFRGYVIPEGTMIIPNLSCVLQDPDIWGDPENFRPERFIGPEGKLTRPEEFIPFSTGRRVCLGESLSRMELFLYLANLIQNFHFLPAEEGKLRSLEPVFGLANYPLPYKIRAVPRV